MVLTLPVGPRDHVRGRLDAPVTLVEYADLECPECGRLEPVLRTLLDRHDEVRLVYRHFPLVEVHPSAYSAALAVEAAGAAGQFWQLHDLLFDNQAALGRRNLARYAEQLGLDPDSVLRPASERFDAKVREDFDSGLASEVAGTPTLFLDGQVVQGALTLNRLEAAVTRAATP
jgi:NhaA family Na+:H+ antiporter